MCSPRNAGARDGGGRAGHRSTAGAARLALFALAATCLLFLPSSCRDRPPSSGAESPAREGDAASSGGEASLPDGIVPSAAGTRRMAQRLDAIYRDLDPIEHRLHDERSAAILREAVAKARNPKQRVVLTTNLADVLLKMGRPGEAIELIRPFVPPERNPDAADPPLAETRAFFGLCHLRRGDLENCLRGRRPDACTFPIRSTGAYEDPGDSRIAIREFSALLERDPGDLGARWLLNLSYMTVGEYPDGVPAAWLIPPVVFESEQTLERFDNVAPRLGLDVRGLAGGGIMEDFDGDALLDIMVSSSGMRDQMRLFRNNGDGTFTERTVAAGLTGLVGGLNMKQADYDNDGDVDVLVLRGGWGHAVGRFPNSLLRNNGDGTFLDVTEEAGILSLHPTQTADWGDYDGDGWLDLVIGNESTPDDPHPSELYRNDGDGTFTDRSINLGDTDFGYVKAVQWGDINDDGRPDLYLSILNAENRMFRNDGPQDAAGTPGADWRFTDVSRETGTTEPRYSFAIWFWDYDNDGRQDLLVNGYRITDVADTAAMYLGLKSGTEMPRLYHNDGDGRFTEVSRRVRLNRVAVPMGCNFGDIDNDGYLDAYFGTGEPSFRSMIPNQLFRNAAGKVFQDVTATVDVGYLGKGHSVAFGDIDNDGDQDFFVELGGHYEGDISRSVLLRNPGHGHRWITLRAEGRRSNRSAIGTRIRVRVNTPTGRRDIHVTVGSGGSFGASSLQQEIGLGDAVSIETIEVSWPASGETQTFRDVALDRVYRMIEGEARLVPVEVRRFDL